MATNENKPIIFSLLSFASAVILLIFLLVINFRIFPSLAMFSVAQIITMIIPCAYLGLIILKWKGLNISGKAISASLYSIFLLISLSIWVHFGSMTVVPVDLNSSIHSPAALNDSTVH